jgi:DNA polymerase-1
MTTRDQVCGKGAKQSPFVALPRGVLAEFAGERADLAGQIAGPLRAALERDELVSVYRDLELPLVPVLAELEWVGVKVDTSVLAAQSSRVERELAERSARIHALAGMEFNINSPKQLAEVLFDRLQLPVSRRTGKTRTASTAVEVLEELAAVHELPREILEWRAMAKLKGTYIDALPQLVHPETGRVHTTFNQAVAATGRLSSSDPNLQNIPIRTDLGRRIRSAFVAGGEDLVLLAADYSQIELRILAHVSGDVHLREAFAQRADIHRQTAARVLKKDPADVTADERSMAKMVNFGLAYGMSDYGLATRAGIPREEAREFIESYFGAYSGIAYYMLHVRELAREQGYVETLLGRRRSIPELSARNAQLRGAGERMAINMPIQGTAADIMKIALIRLHERLASERSAARMLLSVHDEVLLEVPRSEVESLAPIVRQVMEGALRLDVPLDVDVKVERDWESMTVLERP